MNINLNSVPMDDMQQFLKPEALTLLVIGGLAYTIGALFYA